MDKLTHFDEIGAARMVDVGDKAVSQRLAEAEAIVIMQPQTAELIRNQGVKKGDVLQVARLAGIMGAKRTADLIPLCHVLPLEKAELQFEFLDASRLRIRAEVRVTGKTGVEMEALTAVTTAALTIYDMCKSVDRGMEITAIRLTRKSGGKSGDFVRTADDL